MKKIHGLELIYPPQQDKQNLPKLAELIMADLENCQCQIWGSIEENDNILLASLALLADSMSYERFDQRIDLVVSGRIIRNDCVPLTYQLSGKCLSISGRCSMIPRVCGVDLYLQKSYTGIVGDIARQKFSIHLNQLIKAS